jgi:hypothetical protein
MRIDRAAFRRWRLAVGQAAGGNVGVDALIGGGLGVVITPVARVHRHHIRQRTGGGGDPLQHGLQVLSIRRLVAGAHRHNHLVVPVHCKLAVVALQIGAAGLH